MIVLTTTPMSLCAAAATEQSQPACSCAHAPGDNAACPMHHYPASRDARCHCGSSAPDAGTAAIGALLGPAGVLTNASPVPAPPASASPVRVSPSIPASWIAGPDGPPPRA